MDNQQAQALFAASNAASVSLNQLAAAIAEASGVLQVLATAANTVGLTPAGGQAPTFQQPGGAPVGQHAAPGQQTNVFAPGGAPQQQYAPPSGAPVGNQPAPTGAPGAAAPAADSGKRKRRTKAEIAADEAAIAAGFTSHADMLAKTGGNPGAMAGTGGAAPGAGQAAPGMQQAPMAAGAGPVQGMQPVQAGMSSAPQQQPAGPSPDDAQAAFIRVINAVEAIWPGHGQGQAGILFNRYGGGAANVGLMTPEQRANIIQWCDYFIRELQAGRLPAGAEGLPAQS